MWKLHVWKLLKIRRKKVETTSHRIPIFVSYHVDTWYQHSYNSTPAAHQDHVFKMSFRPNHNVAFAIFNGHYKL